FFYLLFYLFFFFFYFYFFFFFAVLPFGAGRRQRHAVLEALALVEPCARSSSPLRSSDPRAPEIRFSLEGASRRAS
ncbi:MAG: hypothetical protein KDD47_11810, partial [Acidobacteria bacterium]|nr:hypothetical protein [Acidobacteriota bacterium]